MAASTGVKRISPAAAAFVVFQTSFQVVRRPRLRWRKPARGLFPGQRHRGYGRRPAEVDLQPLIVGEFRRPAGALLTVDGQRRGEEPWALRTSDDAFTGRPRARFCGTSRI